MSDKLSKSSSKDKPEGVLKPGGLAQNVFTNDGNFLQRFKRAKDDNDEKDARDKALQRKRDLETRIKNRGKRRKAKAAKEDEEDATAQEEDKDKDSKEMSSAANAYLKEMKQYSDKMGNDEGSNVRPLVK